MLKQLQTPGWRIWLWLAVLAVALSLMVRADLACVDWASKLSMEGSPPPAQDATSPTGYVFGQRHFLGTHERGETYRWIAATQDMVAFGPWASSTYHADNVPVGRPRLMPKLYTFWLASVAWAMHVTTGETLALAVERAALWEPVISHVLLFAAAVGFMWTRFGATRAGIAGLFFSLFPPLTAQFLPGALTPRTWAIFFAAYAIALHLPTSGSRARDLAFSARSAVAAAFALWLEPALGFPAVLISAATGIAGSTTIGTRPPVLAWSLIGASVTLVAWLVDRTPWDIAASELRFVHPLYAFAWLGIGLALDGARHLRTDGVWRKWRLAEVVAAICLTSALVYVQLKNGHKGWLYTSASMRRLTSVDETVAFGNVIDWMTQVSVAEAVIVVAPTLFAAAVLTLRLVSASKNRTAPPSSSSVEAAAGPAPRTAAILFAGLLALAAFKVRSVVIVSLVSLPLIAALAASASLAIKRLIASVATFLLLCLAIWGAAPPDSLRRPSKSTPPRGADIEALVYRHCSHWIASHSSRQKVSALAPPDLSDSLVFHGGCRVLMSTAWESYLGQVAASRVLSAPEASEAEAVLQSREITHILLPSWDKILPLLVRKPDAMDKDTLYERLQRWVHPPYLRPMPYRLPPTPGYLDQKLAVFKVTPPQDEALALSRLAEYFAEMDRTEPAGLVAKVLAESFPDDPNAAIARAIVYAKTGYQNQFDRELVRLAAAAKEGQSPFSWDRRVQRAIVLALGRRRDLARAEVEACLATVSDDALFELTPLQAYRLHTLASRLGVSFPNTQLADLLQRLGAEFSPATVSR